MNSFHAEYIGPASIAGGVALRVLGAKALWPNFSASVRVPPHLVTTGVYRWVRHPMYIGSVMILLGVAATFMSGEGFVLMALLCYFYYGDRMAAEDALLRSAFGHEFERYAMRTRRFIPLPKSQTPGAKTA